MNYIFVNQREGQLKSNTKRRNGGTKENIDILFINSNKLFKFHNTERIANQLF